MKTKTPRRKNRPNRKSLRTLDPARFNPPVPPSGLLIASVQRSGVAEQVKVFFSSNITWNGTDTPTALKVTTSDGVETPLDVLDTGANWIEVEFNGSVSAGAAWQVDGLMAGITPAVAWTQSGVVTA